MAFYGDEEEVWKCPKHPSKRRKTGICPTCLRDRLVNLCPDCANMRPCECCPTASASSSSSSSSSFSFFSRSGSRSGVGSVGRLSNLIDSEPAFRRSRSVAVPFLRSRFPGDGNTGGSVRKTSSFWSVFKLHKSKKTGGEEGREDEESNRSEVEKEEEKEKEKEKEENYARQTMMWRSRSVSVPVTSDTGAGRFRSSSKGRGWHFPSPIGVFRHSKTPKVVQERSPLYRG